MQHDPRHRRAAAALYGTFGLMVLAIAALTESPVALAIAVLSLLMVPLAFTRYPIDRAR